MLNLDRHIWPDPFNPVLLDAYGQTDTPHECIIADIDAVTQQVMVCWRGAFAIMPGVRLPVFLRSAGLQPQGRMVEPPKERDLTEPADRYGLVEEALRLLDEAATSADRQHAEEALNGARKMLTLAVEVKP